MNQPWIVVLVTAGTILAVDLMATQLHQRARRMTVPPKPFSEQEEPNGSTDGEITIQVE